MSMPPLTLPADDQAWAAFLSGRADGGLSNAQACIETLKDGSHRSAAEVLELWNDAAVWLDNVESICELLAQVHPDETVRTLAEDCGQRCARLAAERDLDGDLYAVLATVDTAGLDPTACRLLDRTLRDFRRAGVDRPVEVRERLRGIAERSTVLMQDYSRNVRDGVRSITVTPDRLAGLPADFRAEHPPGDDGLVTLTTDYPDLYPVRAYAADAGVRRDLVSEFFNVGWPVNDGILRELLQLRAEQAALLGYANWPDYDAEIKMIGSSAAIAAFIDELSELAAPAVKRDVDTLVERRRRDDPTATGLTFADVDYYTELVRREQYGVDAQQVRRFFSVDRVRAGLLNVTGRLFGLDFRVVDAPVWHPDVQAYDVYRAGSDDLLGRSYLDLHPRPGKYSHAAQFTLVRGVAGRQLPEGVLVCNLARGQMDHEEVVVLFHEFGHLIHHILGGGQQWLRFSGVATEFDFIEAPSQMLEEWAWDPAVLQSFAVDDTGTSIPADLVERMRSANDFGRARDTATQLYYTAVCHQLHLVDTDDLTGVVRAVQARYDALEPLDGSHLHAGFLHLMQYTSAYYAYQWSLVIAKDLLSAFDRSDLLDAEVARRYRDAVIAPGGSRDAASLVEDFLGRPYSMEPYRRWLTNDS